jgi:hypothetical protein
MEVDTPRNASFESFILKEKIGDMMKYGYPLTMQFSRKNRELADQMRVCMLTLYRKAVEIEKKYYKKTTTQELDVELDVLRHLVRMAADKDFCGTKYAPPLTAQQYKVWATKNDEIGRLIGGYIKSLK